MDFKAEDFKHLRWNVQEVPRETDLLEAFPELGRYPELTAEITIDRNKVIRFIILCYDKKSPLLAEKNLIKRKVDACTLAGIEKEDGKFPKDIEEMISNKNLVINRMICRYSRLQSDLQYSLLAAGLENFYGNVSILSAPNNGQMEMDDMVKKAKLYEHTVDMIATLEKNAFEVFAGDPELMYTVDEIAEEEAVKIRSFPEHIATLRELKESKK